MVAYASDMSLIDSILMPHKIRWDDEATMVASLDHCMWFHRPLRADRWLLFDQESPNAYGARGLARGLMFDEEGHLVVSLVQEGPDPREVARTCAETNLTGRSRPWPSPSVSRVFLVLMAVLVVFVVRFAVREGRRRRSRRRTARRGEAAAVMRPGPCRPAPVRAG